MQLTHYTSKFSRHTFPITIVCDNVSNASNLGGLLRTADAFGVEKLFFCGENIELNRKALRTSRAAEKYVDFTLKSDINEVLEELKNNNYAIVALEITSDSQAINTIDFELNKPIALVIGDENFGVSKSIIEQADIVTHIEMFGENSSMNVTQAAGIALFEITRQLM